MPNYLVLSTSGNPDSNSRRMAQIAFDSLKKAKLNCQWLDISKLDLPLCDADACYNHPAAQNLTAAV
jgi:NAD(P)H-dependent FMN reductase